MSLGTPACTRIRPFRALCWGRLEDRARRGRRRNVLLIISGQLVERGGTGSYCVLVACVTAKVAQSQ